MKIRTTTSHFRVDPKICTPRYPLDLAVFFRFARLFFPHDTLMADGLIRDAGVSGRYGGATGSGAGEENHGKLIELDGELLSQAMRKKPEGSHQ